MADAFPGVGHKYLVDFAADDGTRHFKVQLDFHSLTSLTYTGVASDGTLTGNSETVNDCDPADTGHALPRGVEGGVRHDRGTSGGLQGEEMRITTNITSPTADPKKPSFMKLSGPMRQIP